MHPANFGQCRIRHSHDTPASGEQICSDEILCNASDVNNLVQEENDFVSKNNSTYSCLRGNLSASLTDSSAANLSSDFFEKSANTSSTSAVAESSSTVEFDQFLLDVDSSLSNVKDNASILHQTLVDTCEVCSVSESFSSKSQIHGISVEQMKRRLKFFFMNPIEKWQAKNRFPWKLLVQIIKIVVVTIQLCLFAQQRYIHVSYLWDTRVSFSHLLIKGWDSSREISAYPPAVGPLAVYRKEDFFQYLDFAIVTYAKIPDTAIGAYSHEIINGTVISPEICTIHYKSGHADINNDTYSLDNHHIKSCIIIPLELINNTKDWSTKDFLNKENFSLNFDLLLGVHFIFHIKTIKLRVNLPYEVPECYALTGTMLFNNHDHDGQMLVDLDIEARVLECQGNMEITHDEKILKELHSLANISTIVICTLSFIMCIRAIIRAQVLCKTASEFCINHFQKELTFDERMRFVNFWYVIICINDILIIIGSFIKIGLETKRYEGYLDTWNVCSVLLGVGNLLVWFGCLRYLGFFATYNVLILTLKKCLPSVLRYSLCILMLFSGYSLCGWLVLGPYHLKFRSYYSTMECLYSLINGDDMFATFSSMSTKDPLVWWFSRVYLYSFISLFVYVILSLFIAIIMDSYETIKLTYKPRTRQSLLDDFVNECHEDPASGVFHDDGDKTIVDFINSLFCCSRRRSYERIPE